VNKRVALRQAQETKSRGVFPLRSAKAPKLQDPQVIS